MGNNLSTTNQTTTSPLSSMDDLSDFEKKKILKDHDFSYILNYIATRYILTMDFQSLKNLQDPKYCDEMIILTSDIIKKYYNEREVEFLQQKIEQGQQTNKLSKDKMLYFNKNYLSNTGLDNGIKKTGITPFFTYSSKDANCQHFILSLLHANGIYGEDAFVKQDTDSMFQSKNNYMRKLTNTITDLGHKADVLVQGEGVILGGEKHYL